MGSDRCSRSRSLVVRCCNGAFFGFGFVFTILAIVAMFWIAWCYFGLAVIQPSESQRRAAVDWSNGSSKSLLPTATTTSPIRSTTSAIGENSSNSISKLPTTESQLLRGSSRGESQVKFNKRKDPAIISSASLAKGDFAARDKETSATDNTTALPPKVAFDSTVPSPRGPPKSKDESVEKASILTGSTEDSEEDQVYVRRGVPPGPENRPQEKAVDRSRLDISPTKVYDAALTGETSRVEKPHIRPSETRLSDYPDRSEIQSSRRSDSDSSTIYRDPDFDRESPRHSTSYVRGDSRYDDSEDDRGSRSRYDKRDRGRQSDDRLSKGDTRVYPDDRDLPVDRDDRYSVREKYPEDASRRGDDERYRDYDNRPRTEVRGYRDRDTRYRDRDSDDRIPIRDDRYREDSRYRPRDEGYKDQEESRYRTREDDRYKSRDGDRYVPRDDDRYKYRDEERYRDDDRYRPRDGDDKYRNRDDDRYRADDRYRTRDDERYRDDPVRPSNKRDDYRPRSDDTGVRSISSAVDERKVSSSRSNYDPRADEAAVDYDRSRTQEGVSPSRVSRPSYDEDRYRERDRRPSRYDDEDRPIAPTRTRNDYSLSKSSMIDSRPRENVENSRYLVEERDIYQEDRVRNTRLQGSRNSSPVSESSRRYADDDDDERYRTRLPNERNDNPKRKEEVVLDRRSYASEGSDEYRRRGNSGFDDEYDDRTRRPVDESRRPVDEPRRPVDEPRRPVDEPRRPIDEPRRLVDEPRRPVNEPRRPIDEPIRPVDEPRRPVDEPRRFVDEGRKYKDDEVYSRRDPVYDDEHKSSKGRDDYERERRTRTRDKYDDEYDRYPSRDERIPPLPLRKYDSYDDERPARRDTDVSSTIRKEDSRTREENLRPSPSYRDEQRSYSRSEYPDSKSPSRRRYDDDLSLANSRDTREDDRYSRKPTNEKEPSEIVPSRVSSERTDTVSREKRFQTSSSRRSGDEGGNSRNFDDMESKSRDQTRPLSHKEAMEAAIRHSDGPDQKTVHYPRFNPRSSNSTSPEIIRPGDRRGTTITAKKRRSA